MKVAIELMREAFLHLSNRQVNVPVRTVIESGKGIVLFMPSYSPHWELFGLKMVSVFPSNKLPFPVVQGKMMVMSSENGKPLALLDAAELTALRTGAASGLASELLSNEQASTLGLFGTGAQSFTQAEGVMAVRKIKKIIVRGTSRDKELNFCHKLSEELHVDCSPMEFPGELKEADILCTATTSHSPLFSLPMLKPGAHINGIGSFKSHMREIDGDVIKASLLVVDQREAALEEAGDIVIPIKEGLIKPEDIHAELGEIVGRRKSGRETPSQITVFKSVGNAIQDLAVANYLVNAG